MRCTAALNAGNSAEEDNGEGTPRGLSAYVFSTGLGKPTSQGTHQRRKNGLRRG